MKKLVFDIETIGVNFEELAPEQQEYLLKYAKTEQEQDVLKNSLGLYPFTGRIVTIGMYDIDSNKGIVFYSKTINLEFDLTNLPEIVEDQVTFIQLDEKKMLEYFWKYSSRYNIFITFNGRCFDIPFIKIRSAILNVKCSFSMKNYSDELNYYVKSSKFQNYNNLHIDLLDVLTFNGSIRRFNLDFYCRSFGIESPKQNISGKDVQKYLEEGRGLDVAKYCYKDVLATAELFRRCEQSFLLIK